MPVPLQRFHHTPGGSDPRALVARRSTYSRRHRKSRARDARPSDFTDGAATSHGVCSAPCARRHEPGSSSTVTNRSAREPRRVRATEPPPLPPLRCADDRFDRAPCSGALATNAAPSRAAVRASTARRSRFGCSWFGCTDGAPEPEVPRSPLQGSSPAAVVPKDLLPRASPASGVSRVAHQARSSVCAATHSSRAAPRSLD